MIHRHDVLAIFTRLFTRHQMFRHSTIADKLSISGPRIEVYICDTLRSKHINTPTFGKKKIVLSRLLARECILLTSGCRYVRTNTAASEAQCCLG